MKDFIMIDNAISGYFAVLMSYDEGLETYLPYQTGIGRYKTRKEAEKEAKMWAEMEGIEVEL